MPQAGPSATDGLTRCHEMRITEHTSLRCFVAFGLKLLQENPDRPLVFHTLPPKENQTADRAYDDNNDNIRRVDKKSAIPRATHSITQLISVVEIIKRTYAAWALAQKGADGRHAEPALRTGLHQYNELCTLESLGIVTKEDEAVKLKQILGGGHCLRKQWPHLRVTLSVNALPQLQGEGVTYQPPTPLPLSRTARKKE